MVEYEGHTHTCTWTHTHTHTHTHTCTQTHTHATHTHMYTNTYTCNTHTHTHTHTHPTQYTHILQWKKYNLCWWKHAEARLLTGFLLVLLNRPVSQLDVGSGQHLHISHYAGHFAVRLEAFQQLLGCLHSILSQGAVSHKKHTILSQGAVSHKKHTILSQGAVSHKKHTILSQGAVSHKKHTILSQGAVSHEKHTHQPVSQPCKTYSPTS